jgi:hypothetical protein
MSNAAINEILVFFVCPAIGTFLCVVMWYDKTATTDSHQSSIIIALYSSWCYGCRLSPCTAILKARQETCLGSLNPLPFALTIVNCIGWSAYGLIRRDFFIYFANSSGEGAGATNAMMMMLTLTGCVTLYYRTGTGVVLCSVIDGYPILPVHEQRR